MESYGCDVFPSQLINDSGKFFKYELNFESLRTTFPPHSFAFVSWMPRYNNPGRKIYYKKSEKTESVSTHEMWVLRCTDHVREIGPLSWDYVLNKLERPLKTSKNCDQRLCFRHQSIFLVKCYFTFGFRTVAPNQYHLIQTGKNSILFYKEIKSFPKIKDAEQRSLKVSYEKHFEKFVLAPETLYYVSSNTRYVLMAYQKSLFAIDVVAKAAWKVLKKQYNFLKVKRKSFMQQVTRLMYDDILLPPQTPVMDQMVDLYTLAPEDEEEKIPQEPNAESFFKKPSKLRKKRCTRKDEDGFTLPFLPTTSRESTVSCTYNSESQELPEDSNFEQEEEMLDTSLPPDTLVAEDSNFNASEVAPQPFVESSFGFLPSTSNEMYYVYNQYYYPYQISELANLGISIQNASVGLPSNLPAPEASGVLQEPISNASEVAPRPFLESSFDVTPSTSNEMHDVYVQYPFRDYENYPSDSEIRESANLDTSIENASVALPSNFPNDSEMLEAIKDWLKDPNLDFVYNVETNPPELPMDLYSDIFN